jgi:predicted KAP-like P-loop ATPase
MMGDEYILGDDQPKKNPWQDDRLGYAPFAERLANVIINMNIPNGYVIGLHGRWGSGKTTIVNFTQTRTADGQSSGNGSREGEL